MYSFYIKFTFILVLIFTTPINSQEDETKINNNKNLHYFTRLARDCCSGSFLARLASIFLFIFYVLIILGLIKGIIGICCNQDIGMAGLSLVIEPQLCEECYSLQPQINCQTEFCLNVVFFLVAPCVLLWRMLKNAFLSLLTPCKCNPEYQQRMEGGKDDSATIKQSNATIKTKKPTMDVYRDGDDSETYDTNYVLQQLHLSEQSIRTGTYQLK